MTEYIRKAESIRRKLHDIPESSMKEEKTKQAILDFLKEETSLEISDEGPWLYAAWRNPAAVRSLAFRADFDAVTGEDGIARHLCGHDGHTAILCGLAKWVSDTRPDCNVFLIFQPGEESGEGALYCKELFRKEKIDEIYGLHNIPGVETGTILLRKGTFACASTGLSIKLSGSPAHAAYPEYGANPAEACAEIIGRIAAYAAAPHRGMVKSTVIGIDLGSDRYGVSASEGVLRLTVRAELAEEFDAFLSFIREVVKETSEKHGIRSFVEMVEPFPATENSDACVEKLWEAALEAKLPVEALSAPFRWSEDFGHYLKEVPGAFFGIGSGTETPALHTADYTFNDAVIPYALQLLQTLILKTR